jgi:NAD(P)-dependent dehydrogenase (short-subunit alcohol dehydrogenase family)
VTTAGDGKVLNTGDTSGIGLGIAAEALADVAGARPMPG